eukprot:9001632-Pyramimonas_sp.AAC.1
MARRVHHLQQVQRVVKPAYVCQCGGVGQLECIVDFVAQDASSGFSQAAAARKGRVPMSPCNPYPFVHCRS